MAVMVGRGALAISLLNKVRIEEGGVVRKKKKTTLMARPPGTGLL